MNIGEHNIRFTLQSKINLEAIQAPWFLIIALMTVLLGACSSNPELPTHKFLGLLEVRVEGIADGAVTNATARFVDPSSLSSGLQTRSATVLPINGTNAGNDVQLVRRQVSFLDDDVNAVRYVQSRFELINRTSTSFNNLTFYALDIPGTTLGGTGIASMFDATGLSITDPAKARAFQATHGMKPLNRGVEVNSSTADLQLFTPLEISNTNPASLGVQQQAVALNIIPNTATVLEYGFVARNFAGSRGIGARNLSLDCTVDACKGQITLAYKFPKITPRAANPFAFNLYFVVADETNYAKSQSLEEQSANTISGLVPPLIFTQIRTLADSSYGLNDDFLNPLCKVRMAVNPDAFLGTPAPSSSGSLDDCFGVAGKRTTDFGLTNDTAAAVKIQTDGKIVVAGSSASHFALVRYNLNGSLDNTFGTNGKVTTSFNSIYDAATALDIQSDGKIIAVGNVDEDYFALVRYNTNGTLDNSFGTGGKVTTDFGFPIETATAVGIQLDGKIVVTGHRFNGASADIALGRYNPNGTLDSTFGTGGKVIITSPSDDFAYALQIQSDQKIVVAGYSNSHFALFRYNPNGTLDTTFGTGGQVIGSVFVSASALQIQPDQKIVVAGISFNGSNQDFALARYNTNGSLDRTLGLVGTVTTDFGSSDDIALALKIQTDGKIVVAGYSAGKFALARYNTRGFLDTTFGTGGKVTTAIGSTNDEARGIDIQTDGKIILAGSSDNGTNSDVGLTRYNP